MTVKPIASAAGALRRRRAQRIPLRRIELDAQTTLWLPAPSGAARGARGWRVRPAGLALGALLAACAFLRLGANAGGVLAGGLLGVLGVLTVIDIEHRVLPNRILATAAAGVGLVQATFFRSRLVECTVAAILAAVLLLLPSLVRRDAVGMGDVKLAALLGAALGGQVLVALLVGWLATAPVALVMLARGSAGRRATLPLGPFLTLGAAIVLLG